MTTLSLHDRYDILHSVGRGGTALVSLAREVDTGREVALKQMTAPEGARLDEWRLRFQQEFHTASRLRHPRVVATYDYAVGRDGVPFFTMEYLPGPGLEETVPLSAERVLALLPDLLQALGYLHSLGLVHGDLKPENLRFAADGTIRLMDMGLVTRAGQSVPSLQGTFPYLPPEMIRGMPLDRRADLYSLGAVLYHLLAGSPPFEGTPREVLRCHLETAPAPLSLRAAGVPAQLEALVMRLLAKDPLQRFQSASEALLFLGVDGAHEDDQTLFYPPLLGRSDELAQLDAELARVKREGYGEVWVYGEADVGLAPLLEEFCCRAQLSEATLLRGAFRARMGPLEGLRGVVGGLMALLRHREDELAHLRPILARVLPELGPAAEADRADPQQERLRLFDAVLQLLRLASEKGPLVLAFNQAHLAAPTWRELVDHLRRNAAALPVMLVATWVGEPEMELDPARSYLEVEPLPERETHAICCAILGQGELPEVFTGRVHALTGGYPGRIEALLRGLAAAGKLTRSQGAWQLPEEPLETLLSSINTGWAREQEIQALPPLARRVLKTLYVHGDETELVMLYLVACETAGSGQEEDDNAALFEALQLLEDGGWIAARQGRYQLAPEAPGELVAAGLADDERRSLHAAIALALSQRYRETPGDVALLAALARHSLGAEDVVAGPRYALEAAGRQARLFELESAEDLLREALALAEGAPAPDAVAALALWRLRADVARHAGDRRLAESGYREAAALAERLGDTEAQCAIANGLGRLKMITGELEAAEALFTGVVERLPDAPHPELASALTSLGRSCLTRGDLVAARAWVERALTLARAGDFRPLLRENMAQLGFLYVATEESRSSEGLRLLFEALQMTEKDEAKLELNACYALLGNAQLLLGHFAEAKLAFQRNCDLCAEIGAAPHDEATAFMRRAAVEFETGDYLSVRASVSPASALARMVGNRLLLAQVRAIEAVAALYRGEYTTYQDASEWIEAQLKVAGSASVQAMWRTLRAEAEGFLGQWSDALSQASQALEVIATGAGREYHERATIVKAEALMRLGLAKPARQALEALGPPRNQGLLGRLHLAQAQLERLDGQPKAARAEAARAFDLARRTGVAPLAAASGLLLARVTQDREEALAWGRKALIDAEACAQPALEAEALYLAASQATRRDQSEWLLTAAEEAWRRATASFTPGMAETFGKTEERRPLVEALARRAKEGYRLSADEQQRLLELVAIAPTRERLLPAVLAWCKESARLERAALYWADAAGQPRRVAATGHWMNGTAAEELEAARQLGARGLLMPLTLAASPDEPWGALLIEGVTPDAAERLRKLTSPLMGVLWAARALWLAEGCP